jgi:L-alanine-DL-glutamate epimerase-like enolase superfamily enzyme
LQKNKHDNIAAGSDISRINIPVSDINVKCFDISTKYPESDGTLQWDKTTMVFVEIIAGDCVGIGYSYADLPTGIFIKEHLAQKVTGQNCLNNTLIWQDMRDTVRNLGNPGVASMAVSAIDIALLDLKSKILQLPLAVLLGMVSSDNLDGLYFVRDHAPARMNIAAGEYGYNVWYFNRMLNHQALHIAQVIDKEIWKN